MRWDFLKLSDKIRLNQHKTEDVRKNKKQAPENLLLRKFPHKLFNLSATQLFENALPLFSFPTYARDNGFATHL